MLENIEQIKMTTVDLTENMRVSIPLLVQKKERRISANAKERLEIIGSDISGTLVINFWDEVDKMDQRIKEGHIYTFSGATTKYNERINMNGKYVQEIIGNKSEYIPKYTISATDYKTFDTIINFLPMPNKRLVEELTGYNRNTALWSKFTQVPVTERNHYNKVGGLFLHTLNVTKLISRIIKNYPANTSEINTKRLITKALLHDIGKLDEFIIDDNTFVVKKIETDIEHNIKGALKVLQCNAKINLFNQEDIDNISYGIMSHKGEFGEVPIKNIEDKILYHADILDIQIFNNVLLKNTNV